jgi:hypothetical protein
MEISDELQGRIDRLSRKGWRLTHADLRPADLIGGNAPFRFEGPTQRNSTPSVSAMSLRKAVELTESEMQRLEDLEEAEIKIHEGHLGTNI